MEKSAYHIHVTGLVQGVGFRPFIYRLAQRHGVTGTVENNNKGVYIWAEGEEKSVKSLVKDVRNEAPAAAAIDAIQMNLKPLKGYTDFEIIPSHSFSNEITEISPDIAVCDDCLEDIKQQPNRLAYPLTNCTNCGPRFTIIKALPYDRPNTTMAPFVMCPACESEYINVMDRRFHAQPIACHDCGPHYTLHYENKRWQDITSVLDKTAALIDGGKIVAVKGMGGFHLACDAFQEETVALLRERKSREGKPFAVMFRNITVLKKYLNTTDEEEKLLASWRRPVVLLKQHKVLSYSISKGLDTVGAMLPYMPFHYLLFEKMATDCIVLTSGNIADDPVLIDNEEALENLASVADATVTYNRAIHNRADDTVAMVVNGKTRLIRRSRSYVPSPVHLDLNAEGIFAAGAELVNCFAIGKSDQAILSQHIGDLKNMETLEFYEESYRRFQHLFRFTPELVVCDLHPDYLSTGFAEQFELPVLSIQHHHAHIASCMAEHHLDEKVIGVSFDGTGLGTDGKIWGGDFLVCDLSNFERVAHFEYIPMPGGDLVTNDPRRMAMAYLHHYFGKEFLEAKKEKLFADMDPNTFDTVLMMLDQNINSPESDSAGRLFDAVAALTRVCRLSAYHAEAPMRLEAIAAPEPDKAYHFDFNGETISFKPTFEEILKDMENNVAVSLISARFHCTIVNMMCDVVQKISKRTGLKKVVISGGTFQNRILLSVGEKRLHAAGLEVFSHEKVPSNDGGIALGQLAIAAKRRILKNK